MSQSNEIDVRSIPKPQRHPLIFDAMEKLAVGQSVTVKNDHNPIPLRGQVEALFGEQFAWDYLDEGPEIFRLRFTRRAVAPAGWHLPEPKVNTLNLQPPSAPPPIWVDLLTANRAAHSGPQWAHESDDLDATLLSWRSGERIAAHVNTEVDVIWIGIEGSGVATIDGAPHDLRAGVALLIPKGCERALESTSEKLTYFSVHRRRRGLMPTFKS